MDGKAQENKVTALNQGTYLRKYNSQWKINRLWLVTYVIVIMIIIVGKIFSN